MTSVVESVESFVLLVKCTELYGRLASSGTLNRGTVLSQAVSVRLTRSLTVLTPILRGRKPNRRVHTREANPALSQYPKGPTQPRPSTLSPDSPAAPAQPSPCAAAIPGWFMRSRGARSQHLHYAEGGSDTWGAERAPAQSRASAFKEVVLTV